MARTLVWSIGYRIDHWVRFAAVALLVLTGFYIHSPFFGGGPESAIMATMRWIHFISAYVLVVGLVIRLYMAFNSRFEADWQSFSPWGNLIESPSMISYYLFIRPDHRAYERYNPLQALTYFLILVVFILQAMIGFAIYKGEFFGLFQSNLAFAWVTDLLGGESAARIWHFLIMWVVIIFTAIHVYFGAVQSWWERDNTFWSIFSGYKNR